MKILLMMVVVQSLNVVVFAWLDRLAFLQILALRQQLCMYKRKLKPPKLRNRDRLFWSLISRLWRDWRSELIIVKPQTVIRWRQMKFRELWRRKSQSRSGRPAIPNEHIDFIRRISSDHPEYGEDRIALELEVKFGVRHASSTVRRYMVKRRPGPGSHDHGPRLYRALNHQDIPQGNAPDLRVVQRDLESRKLLLESDDDGLGDIRGTGSLGDLARILHEQVAQPVSG